MKFILILILILALFGFISGCVNLQEQTADSVSKETSKQKADTFAPNLSKKTEASAPDVSKKKIEKSTADVSANRVIVSVSGMVCQMCVHGMRKVFKDSVKDAEKDVQVDLGKKTVTLSLVTALSDEDIKKRVVQAGYQANKITRL